MQYEEVTFNVFNAIKRPMESESCFRVDIVEAIVLIQKDHIDVLETSLIYEDSPNTVEDKAREYVLWMNSFGQNKRKYFESLGSILSLPIPSIERPLVLEEKPLPSPLRYAYLGESSTLPTLSCFISLREIVESA